MHIGCCENCRYLDLFENINGKCPRCRGKMVSLEIESSIWNRMSEEDRQAVLDEKVPREQDRDELFKELWGDKYEGAEAEPEPVVAETEPEPEPEAVEAETEAEPEPEPVVDEAEEEPDIVQQLFASQTDREQDEEELEQLEHEYVYACYKCNALAGHKGDHDKYYCTECGSDMVEIGMSTKEWANLSKQEKRDRIEEAKIRHMVTQIKKVSYEDSENNSTPRIINVVNN